ncbi:hypothetical protein HAZT_HAZT005939 [Hyalella azteca]|uniref:60S ribosomal protein L29 n=1 Tax=Hyalella azteca TaxID=294128 RepID=A0A6A0H0N2_HYAAZ|nr:60S ribosomal protein L29-1 [Hyalella azteca]KAA0195128.1 hypothetical protein HAZT_HAZT005939 [Hyalella azteca]
MAKSKNHTNRNKSRKDHKNGIKKPKVPRFPDRLGCCPKFRRNLRKSRKNQVSLREQRKRCERRRKVREIKLQAIKQEQEAIMAKP